MTVPINRRPFGLPDTLVVYDTEATGLDTVHDQVTQIAALRSNLAFEPPSATFEARCRRMPHIVPSPTAMLRTRITPHDLEHAEFSAHMLMSTLEEVFTRWGPALFIGYNSIRFDERVLRQNFFATLHPPYLTQQDGSVRADAMVVAQTVAALAPEAIAVQQGPTGAPSFALGPLCRANGIELAEGDAHDALADAQATLSLLRLLRDRAPDAVAASLLRADKRHVLDLVRRNPVLFLLRWRAGAPVAQAVTPIGTRPGDKNAIVVIDLAFDPAGYEGLLDEGELDAWLAANPGAVRVVRANAFPQIFAPDDPLIDGDRLRAILRRADAAGGSPSPTPRDWAERGDHVQANADLHAQLHRALGRRRPPRPGDATVEERLYERFTPPMDYAVARDMHAAMPWERADHVFRFRDDRLMALAARWVNQTEPDTLDADLRDAMEIEHRRRLLGPADARWRTVAAARAELDALAATAPAVDGERLAEIARYLTWIEATARATA